MFLFIASFSPAGAGAQQYPSARIEALGGEAVSGVIPDTLTDIHLNPAYLHRCRRLTINYGQRETGDFSMRFPYLRGGIPSRDAIASRKETELSIYGISAGSWRVGISAGWYLDYRDDSTPNHAIRYYTWGFREEYSITAYHGDLHDYRIDISAARGLSSGTVLGMRCGAFQRVYDYWHTRQRKYYDFQIDESESEMLFEGELYSYDKSDSYRRVSSFFLQAGLLAGEERSERSLLLQVTRSEIYSRTCDRNIDTQTQYDQSGEVEDYAFDELYYRDERAGVLWSYGIHGRLSLPDGTRIFAGGGFERMRYDTDWLDSYIDFAWRDTWIDSEKRTSLTFHDDGIHDGFHVFLKAGKTVEPRDDLSLTAGVHGFMRWMRSREEILATAEIYSCIDPVLVSFSMERPIDISIETTDAGLNLSLAIEYEPTPWISIWSGFRILATYRKEKDRLSNISAIDLINFLDPSMVASYIRQESPRSVDDLEITSAASFGLSLHYLDRFFVDLYTGSDMTPDYISNYILDVRYAF